MLEYATPVPEARTLDGQMRGIQWLKCGSFAIRKVRRFPEIQARKMTGESLAHNMNILGAPVPNGHTGLHLIG
jgi:hypothetical protein